MHRDNPISVYFTAREKQMLFRLARHCKRSLSDQPRWLVEEYYFEVFGKSAGAKSPARKSR